MTGFYRDGYCRVGPEDGGNHAVAGTLSSHPLLLLLPLPPKTSSGASPQTEYGIS